MPSKVLTNKIGEAVIHPDEYEYTHNDIGVKQTFTKRNQPQENKSGNEVKNKGDVFFFMKHRNPTGNQEILKKKKIDKNSDQGIEINRIDIK